MPLTRRKTLAFQAGYYAITGIFPLLTRRGFEAVTGKKTDWWLVQMVGLLALGNGVALAAGTRSERISEETLTLAILSALSFAAIDIAYVFKRRIAAVYLADAAIELILAGTLLRPD